VQREFSVPRMVQRMEAVYLNVLRRKRNAGGAIECVESECAGGQSMDWARE
jgi:hypothetical protein